MNFLQAAILGLVQGLAEFLPISSSGHLILARALLGISDAVSETGVYVMFDILLHLGTLLAVFVVFWKDWWNILKNPFRSKTLLLLFIASLPTLAAGLLLKKWVDTFFTGWFLGVSFLITSIFLLLAEIIYRHKPNPAKKVGFGHAIVMGIMQAIALLPGVSRSGSTLTGGLASGLERKRAAKFAFMMSAPAILGSLVFEGKDALENGFFNELALGPTILGVAVAAISGYLAIRFMVRLVSNRTLHGFALYTALLGVVVIIMQATGLAGLAPLAIPVL